MTEILLIEDNPGDALLIRQTLAEGPYPPNVHIAVDGEQAIQMLDSGHVEPALIILDLNLPKIPGLLILGRCRTAAPVVVFTSSSNPYEHHRVLELGASEVVQKPTDLTHFKLVVSRMRRKWIPPAVASASGGA